MIGRIKKFMQEVRIELSKVTWTSREELWGSTLIVIVSVAFLTLFIGICDFFLARLIQLAIRG